MANAMRFGGVATSMLLHRIFSLNSGLSKSVQKARRDYLQGEKEQVPRLSSHLFSLEKEGFLTSEKLGKERIYQELAGLFRLVGEVTVGESSETGRSLSLSKQIARDTIWLRFTPRLANTEYSLNYHTEYVREKTGILDEGNEQTRRLYE